MRGDPAWLAMTRLAMAGLAVLVVACSSGGPSSAAIAHPTGDALVLRIRSQGGFVAPQATFSQLPGFSLYGDGRIIVPGAVDEIFPGRALPPLQVRRVSEAGIQAILREVAATGLFTASRKFDAARNFVADAGTTIFTLRADGRDVTISIYGLTTFDVVNPPRAVPVAELAAHRSLARLSERLGNVEGWLPAPTWTDPAWQPFRPEAFRLLVRNASADPPDLSGLGNQLAAWPAASDPATFGDPVPGAGSRCGVVRASDAATWLSALEKANQLTRFVANNRRYEIVARPLLPDEPRSCPASS